MRIQIHCCDAVAPDAPGREGKFVLIRQGEEALHLVLSPVSLTPYHADIVERYLEGFALAQVSRSGSGSVRILTPGWRVRGGGYYRLSEDGRRLAFYGSSQAYGKFDAPLLRPLLGEVAVSLMGEGSEAAIA